MSQMQSIILLLLFGVNNFQLVEKDSTMDVVKLVNRNAHPSVKQWLVAQPQKIPVTGTPLRSNGSQTQSSKKTVSFKDTGVDPITEFDP